MKFPTELENFIIDDLKAIYDPDFYEAQDNLNANENVTIQPSVAPHRKNNMQ